MRLDDLPKLDEMGICDIPAAMRKPLEDIRMILISEKSNAPEVDVSERHLEDMALSFLPQISIWPVAEDEKKEREVAEAFDSMRIAVIGKGKAARKYEYAKLESAATTELIRMCLEGWEDDDVLEDRNDEHDDDDDDDDDTE